MKVYLPRAVGTPAAADRRQEIRAQPGRETVLVVEDDPSIRDLAQRVLLKRGYTVLAAASPGEAVALVGERGVLVDLLVTDVMLPEMSGPDLAKILAAQGRACRCSTCPDTPTRRCFPWRPARSRRDVPAQAVRSRARSCGRCARCWTQPRPPRWRSDARREVRSRVREPLPAFSSPGKRRRTARSHPRTLFPVPPNPSLG